MGSPSTFLFFVVLGILFSIDAFLYRRFVRFVRNRRRLRKYFVVPFGFGVLIVPVLLACASYPPWRAISESISSAILAFGIVYYVPKLIAFVALAVKDTFGFVSWLFNWFQGQLVDTTVQRHNSAPSAETPGDSTALSVQGSEMLAADELANPLRSLDLSDMKQLKRRDFVQQMGMSAVSAPLVLVGYGVFKNLYDFDLRSHEVSIPKLPVDLEGLRIVQLSDLHAGSMFSDRPILEAVEIVNSLSPDIVAITGDFVNEHPHEIGLILPALRKIEASIGVFGCLGNHDHIGDVEELQERLATTSIDLLMNEHRVVSVNNRKLHVIGTDNTGHGQHFGDLTAAMHGIDGSDRESFQLLLAHDPRYWDTTVRVEAPHIDLTLSGHTHGGQFGIERGRVRLGWARLAYQRWAGMYTEFNAEHDVYQQLYVNRGLGHSGAPMRLGIKPEITTLTLKQGTPASIDPRNSGPRARANFKNARLRYIERLRSNSIAS